MCILIVSVTPGNYVGDPGVCYSGPNLLLVTIIASTCAGLSHTAGSGDPRVCNMYVCATLLVLWGSLQGSRATCTTAYGDKIRYCKNFQTDYIEGIEILIFEERDVGRINSTVFSSPNLKSVLSLTLKGSKIHTVESGAFQEFRGLGNIELQDNSLSSLSPAWFHDPTTLRNLTVASNRIGQLRPGMLEGFSNLERLNLSRNLITSVHSESFWGLSKMASLDLSYNKISSLRRQTLSPLNGTSVRLGGNPWNCSCAHKDFILFLKELMNTSRLADPSSVTCHYPADMIGVLVWNVSEMNCSVAALPPPSQAVFQKVVLPVLFVVLGGVFFSLSMWLIICILTSRCKNKVTNMAEPDHPLHQRSDTCAEPHYPLNGGLGSHVLEIGSLHPDPEITSTMQSDHGKDSGRTLLSDLRSSQSEPLVSSVAATVLNAYKTSGNSQVRSAADPVTPSSPQYIQDIGAAGERYRHGGGRNISSLYGNLDETGETGLLTYFETDIDPKTLSNIKKCKIEGHDPLPEPCVSGNTVNCTSLGQKCKTWSTFCAAQHKLCLDPSENSNVSKQENCEFVGKEELKGEPAEGHEETSRTDQEDNKGGGSKSPGVYHMDPQPGEKPQHHDQTLQKATDPKPGSRGEDAQHKGPSSKNKTTKPCERSSSALDKLWKYHKNCCDELKPCQTASTVLRRLKTSEKGPRATEEAKQEPPPDEELLQERTSFPILCSKFSEDQIPTNPAISSKKTCVSLPDLGMFGNHNTRSISAFTPQTHPEVGKEDNGREKTSGDASVHYPDLPVIDLPAPADVVNNEGLAEVSPSKTDLPIIIMGPEGFINTGSGSEVITGDLARSGSEQDVESCKSSRAQDLVNYDRKSPPLPDISAPRGETLREDQQVLQSGTEELPNIDPQTESPLRTEIQSEVSSSDLHLPVLNDDTTAQSQLQDNPLLNLDIPAIDGQAQSVLINEKLCEKPPGIPDVNMFHEVPSPNDIGLPPIDVQSEALVIHRSHQDNGLQYNPHLPSQDKTLRESSPVKPEKLRSNQKAKAKSCPVLYVMLESPDKNPNYNREMVKLDLDTTTLGEVRDVRNTLTIPSDVTTFSTSQVKAMKTLIQESPLFNKEQGGDPSAFSYITHNVETQLTPSASYSTSVHDGDEMSEWPDTAQILKRSSTISLSSKFDILENSTAPQYKEDYDDSTVSHNGHKATNSDFSACDTDTGTFQHLLEYKNPSHEESTGNDMEKVMSDKTLYTGSEWEDTLEINTGLQMTDTVQTNHQSSDHTDLPQTSNFDEKTTSNSEQCGEESSDDTIDHDQLGDAGCYQLLMVSNGQREDFQELEDPAIDVTSFLGARVKGSPPEVHESKYPSMENQENICGTGEDPVIHKIRHNDTLTGCHTGHRDVPHYSHIHDQCEPVDPWICSQEQLKDNPQEDECVINEDRMKESHLSYPEDHTVQSSLRSKWPRSKDVTRQVRKNTKLEANKTNKTDNIAPRLRDIRQDLKDYISTKLLRRPFQSVFPVSVKHLCPEGGNTSNASSLEEDASMDGAEVKNLSHLLSMTSNHPNVTSHNPEETPKMTDAIQYLSYLYARGPKLKTSQEPYRGPDLEEDRSIDDIRVLSNLQFCKVSGGFIGSTEISETMEEAAEEPKLLSSNPNNSYTPPSKGELRADEELAVLHVMYTLKKSLELPKDYTSD
ncbi:uncharacterized protein [Engystomops pustulosus]|uniref:uncharacterized protein n=1 Tax=Engystomops pustulosus TaxID=76066 RepID=UPI003AFB7C81